MLDVGPTRGEANCPKPPDIYNFDEDSGDALSSQQPASQKSPRSTSASPRESGGTEATSPIQVHQYLDLLQFIKHELSMSTQN